MRKEYVKELKIKLKIVDIKTNDLVRNCWY